MDILKPDQNNARNGRVCTNSFLEVKLRQTLGQNGTQIWYLWYRDKKQRTVLDCATESTSRAAQ